MIYLYLFILSFFLTYSIKKIALKKSLLAMPNERSSHSTPTPHGGGVAIVITWFLGLIYLFTCKEIEPQLFLALMVGVILSIVGFMDDLYELSAKKRLLAQVFVSVVGLYMLGGLAQIDVGFFVIKNQIVTNMLAFLGIIWFINLYNFLDGIDGYAGSEAIFLGIAGFLLFGGAHFLVLGVSVLGFLIWNWHKAKIFMGDVGSTLLGYNVAIFTIYYANQESNNLWIWFILFGVFWFDATLTLYRRYKNGEKLSQAHRKHAYQRLTQSGMSHAKVVLLGVGINVVLAMLGYIAFYFQMLLFVCFAIAIALLYGVVRYVDNRKKFM